MNVIQVSLLLTLNMFKTFSIVSIIDFEKLNIYIRKNIFACLFRVHNTISLSRHEHIVAFILFLF